MQVLLIAGGSGDGDVTLSSTEVLTVDSSVWTMVTPLPRAVYGVGSISLHNTVYMTGKVYYTVLYCTILYCIVLYYTILYYLYCTILYYIFDPQFFSSI